MISFRYHLVSIIAVFLALALGIVIGTTALSGPITRDLRSQVNDLKKQRDGLTTQVKTLQGQVDDAGTFATTYGSKLVKSALAGQNVIEVVLPGVPSAMRTGVERELTAAGAKLTGTVAIGEEYLDASHSAGILALATGDGRPLSWTAPETNDAGKVGGSLLSFVLTGRGQQSDLTTVLGTFSGLHMLNQDGNSFTPAKNVVVIADGPAADAYGASSEESLVQALAADGAKVTVAGDSTTVTSNGVVELVRSSGARDQISTVDNADSAFGQVATALALAATINGDVGQYGTGNGAQSLFPQPTG